MAKILILANKDVGLYKFRKELIKELVKDNDVYVSLPYGDYVGKINKLGCKLIDTPINRRSVNPIQDIKLLMHYRKIIRKIKPNLILSYTIKPNVYGGLACRVNNIPYIANITGLGTSIENKGLIQKISLLLYKIGLKKARCVFFQNQSNKSFFIENNIVKGKLRLIPGSGVNLKEHSFEEYPNEDGVIIILFIGRMMKAKGINELLQAAKIIKEKYPYVQFDLVGRSEENYSDILKEFETNKIIKYHGHQNDVHSFIKNSHAVINPSHHEGMSNVLLESASTGRPVLASNIPGCKETFDHNVSGIGFEVNNVDSLVNTIIKFVEMPYKEKEKMGISGRKKMENEFDRNFVINSYLEEIDRIISEEN